MSTSVITEHSFSDMCEELNIYNTQQFKGSLTRKLLIYPYEKEKKNCTCLLRARVCYDVNKT